MRELGQGQGWIVRKMADCTSRSGGSYGCQKVMSWVSLIPFSISAYLLKGTSSVHLVLPQIFCAAFPLSQVSVLFFFSSLSLHLLDRIILPYVSRTVNFKEAESAMGLESDAWSLERSSESLRSQWRSTKILPAGILWHKCTCYEVGCFLFFFLLATQFNTILIVSIIHTQFITA